MKSSTFPRFICCILIFISTIGICQTNLTQPLSTQTPLTIDEKVSQLEKSLSRLAAITKTKIDFREMIDTIKHFPITPTTITKKIDDLTHIQQVTVIQSLIEDSERLLKRIETFKASAEKHLSELADGELALNKAKADYESIQQLLSNPMNHTNAPNYKSNKVNHFDITIQSLTQQFSEQIEDRSLQLRDLDAANHLLIRWQSALSAELLVQKNKSQIPIENKQLLTKSEALKADMLRIQTELSDQSFDLPALEKKQQMLYEKQTLLWLIGIDTTIIKTVKRPTLTLDKETLENLPLSNLEQQYTILVNEQEQLKQLQQSVENRYVDFQKQLDIIGVQPTLEQAFTQRLKAIAYQQLLIQKQPQKLAKLINNKKQTALFSLDTLYVEPSNLTTTLAAFPNSLIQMAYQVQISFQALFKQIFNYPLTILLMTGVTVLLLLIFTYLGHRWIKHASKKKDSIMTAPRKLFFVLRKNRIMLIIILFIVILVRISDVPYPSNHIIRTLMYVLAATVIWLTLIQLEHRLHRQFSYPATYSFFITIWLAGLIVLYAIALMSAVAPDVLGLYEKGMMLSLAIFTWIERTKIVYYFSNPEDKPKNVSKTHSLYIGLLILLPWAIMSICLLSLIGFSRLAWLILGYLGVLVLYAIVLTLGIKLLNHWRKKAKLSSLKRFQHGAFIATDIVSPLSMVSKILWLWATTAVLFHLMNWNSNSYLIAEFLNIVRYPLVTIGSTEIHLQLIALSMLSVYAIFRTARWLRTFSYHWLYAKIQDLGIRGSLSIFTQYVAAVAGVIITLNVLGIDLTSLAVFAGALGVGIGLGLQDIAKNFISGILLLIERPLRNGDWVIIDGNEGTIASIGMRAITMETFDKQEVIIPNGSVIGNSFINNTHSNSVLRTVLYIGAGYESEPEKVIAVLEKILHDTIGILHEPAPLIVLWEYADSSINYRIQYYINIDKSSTFSMRTQVLKKIWHEFKFHHIEIPFPQRDINVRNQWAIESTYPTPSLQQQEKNDE